MSTKRSRKNVIDTTMNNNYKKSKNAGTTDGDSYNNVNIKNREKATISSNNRKLEVGNKRKLSDSDVSPSKEMKKRGKIFTNSNIAEGVDLPSEPSDNFNFHKELKKSKKKNKVPLNNEENMNKNSSDILEPFVQKMGKKKKSGKDKISVDHVNTLVQKQDILSSKVEVGSKNCDEMNVQLNINNFENENVQNEQYIANGRMEDLEDNQSDLNETELFPELVNKAENSEIPKTKEVINWPEEDLKMLVERMETCIPEHDTLAFGTRVEKLEWDTIAFKEYSVEDCKKTWFLLQKKIRRFRLLKEVLADAKEWISAPKSKKKKTSRHPDMPRKPLTAYFIYYMQKKDSLNKTHAGLDATEISKMLGQEFKNLPPEKRLKYENLAAKKKKEYEKKLEEFYQSHPDVPRIVKVQKIRPARKPKSPKLPKPVKEKPQKIPKERIPKRPPPPFHYYYLSELENQKEVDDRLAFKELCKERWKQLPDEKKVVWINNAEIEYAKYEEALTKYRQSHPDSIQNTHKPILTKEEIQIKDRVAGKPSKPPGSAYNLYARILLQSEEIKSVPIRDRLNFVSNRWKNCPEHQKKQYKDLSATLNEKYKIDYASYLETLPEPERKLELQKNLPKRRKSECLDAEKKEKVIKKKSEKKPTITKLVEPEQPPISAFKYFTTLYDGEEPALQAWKALTLEQKKVYEDELVKKKQAYIVDFENFLKSLTKEELEAFSNSRRKIKKEEPEDDDDEEGSGTGSGTDESGTEESGAESHGEDSVD
ncbi:nucleolar transcription factor 1-A-like [Anoplophora glabripennis]|uniref:nucleolar transcription factor 1-A-like n=1 Tax=Anoplophora glabripennis TaxID=217634 RepID=UPI00087598D8|nr:nucleolar transcription factor 1-A-like [Anoplophora glabripennis]XP_018571324.1 nucleolar transcription factor 1-A-like [Anoplophora glabripennis]